MWWLYDGTVINTKIFSELITDAIAKMVTNQTLNRWGLMLYILQCTDRPTFNESDNISKL